MGGSIVPIAVTRLLRATGDSGKWEIPLGSGASQMSEMIAITCASASGAIVGQVIVHIVSTVAILDAIKHFFGY